MKNTYFLATHRVESGWHWQVYSCPSARVRVVRARSDSPLGTRDDAEGEARRYAAREGITLVKGRPQE